MSDPAATDATATSAAPKAISRFDYAPPAFSIHTVELDFQLGADETLVTATLTIAQAGSAAATGDLVLDGARDTPQSGELLDIRVDDEPLADGDYTLTDTALTLHKPKAAFKLTTKRRLSPAGNKSLEGLYASGSGLFTQCEAEGFRKITWFLDRPDVMSTYKVTLRGDATTYPVLLSNGNKVEERVETDGEGRQTRVAVWHDPHKKPCYLFALVAGDLVANSGSFTTMSGKAVELNVWVRKADLDQTEHCLQSLIKSMKWDEERFGREYDLEVFNLVAVSDFNMGAMENKGLNIFNTKYVLARADTATDVDYAGIEAVVGHEYFHNWSGNRVTCRDWFQLSLKEGFTVFRDQEFSSDVGSRAVRRIEEVRRLRSLQFPEDLGPTAHPVRPDSYVEISNFYTVTIYEKGAEVVRMYMTLLGQELFRKGCDLYFSRHDGQAVTVDEFAACMAEVSGRDLTQFKLWYSQAGTPEVKATTVFDAEAGTLTLTLQQTVPPTPGQPDKAPMLVPLKTALLGPDGQRLPLTLDGKEAGTETLVELAQAEQRFVFSGLTGLAAPPVASLNRDFSAPIKLSIDEDDGALLFRLAHDDDPFNRCEAGQELFLRHLLASTAAVQRGDEPLPPDTALIDAVRGALGSGADPALLAQTLSLPTLGTIGDRLAVCDDAAAHKAREGLRRALATALEEQWGNTYDALTSELQGAPYAFAPAPVARRSLRNLCLGYLAVRDGALIHAHLQTATNMTDTQAALGLLADTHGEARDAAFGDFYKKWQHEALMVDKWFALQAMSTRPHALHDVLGLLAHPAFTLENPNRARALVATFGMNNPLHFHDASGAGYAFLADQVIALDAFNPQIAARFLTPLTRWKRQGEARQALMKAELQRVLDRDNVSKDVFEICTKALAG